MPCVYTCAVKQDMHMLDCKHAQDVRLEEAMKLCLRGEPDGFDTPGSIGPMLGSRFCTKNRISVGTNRASQPYLVAYTS